MSSFCPETAKLADAMQSTRRFVYVLFTVLLLFAQREAALHAIAHAGEPARQSSGRPDGDRDGLPHQCPDCARFASLSTFAPPVDAPAVAVIATGIFIVVAATLVARSLAPVRARSRSPPRL
jgi:hypothetical protein